VTIRVHYFRTKNINDNHNQWRIWRGLSVAAALGGESARGSKIGAKMSRLF
jgi:hypothetical protein